MAVPGIQKGFVCTIYRVRHRVFECLMESALLSEKELEASKGAVVQQGFLLHSCWLAKIARSTHDKAWLASNVLNMKEQLLAKELLRLSIALINRIEGQKAPSWGGWPGTLSTSMRGAVSKSARAPFVAFFLCWKEQPVCCPSQGSTVYLACGSGGVLQAVRPRPSWRPPKATTESHW